MVSQNYNTAIRTALIYTVFGILWILLGDKLAQSSLPAHSQIVAQTVKGLIFVGISALLVYFVIRMELKALEQSERRYHLISSVASDYMFSTQLDASGQFRLHWVAGAFEEITGYTFEDYIAHGGWQASIHPDDVEIDNRDMQKLRANQRVITEIRTITKSGNIRWVQVYAHPVIDRTNGDLVGIYGAVRDITERKRAEEALQESEERFRALVENSTDEISIISVTGELLYESPSVNPTLGYQNGENLGKNVFELVHPDDLENVQEKFAELLETPRTQKHDQFRMRHRDGRWRWVEAVGTNLLNEPSVGGIVINYYDISERKQAEEQVNRRVVELEALYQSGIAFSQTLDPVDIGEKIIEVLVGQLDWHHAAVRVRREESQDVELLAFSEAEGEGHKSQLQAAVTRLGQGLAGWVIEHGESVRSNNLTDDPRYVTTYEGMKSGLYVPLKIRGKTIGCISAESDWENAFSAEDERLLATLAMQAAVALENASLFQSLQDELAEHQKTEIALMESEARFRLLIDQLPAIVYLDDVQAYPPTTQFISPRIKEILGYDPGEWQAGGFEIWKNAIHPDDRERALNFYFENVKNGSIVSQDYRMTTSDGRTIWVHDSMSIQMDKDGTPISLQGIISDITENKEIEATMRLQSAALETTANAIVITDLNGVIQWVNPAYSTLTGYSASEAVGKSPHILYSGMQGDRFYKDLWNTILAGKTWRGELINKRKDGTHYHEEQTITPLLDSNGKITHFIGVKQDITSRKQAERQIQKQFEQLTALRDIDQAIVSSFDMQVSLNIILSKTVNLLAVDAASVLLLSPSAGMLEYIAGTGFHTYIHKPAIINVGDSYAGKAVMERAMIQIPNLADEPNTKFMTGLLKKEERFASYYCMPLLAKGQVVGVLEVFNRTVEERNEEWLDFFGMLAGQTAIAIENARLFEGIQQSNAEMMIAYDATIEGWSRAMDLRDKETEGHTQRVTELTLKLAKRLGISEQEQVQMRRGALLHDIGKLGVPDHILLKPDKLTDEEWEIMRQHPTYAFEMLQPIKYLRPALDIPYAHHEKWDGSGYPRKLKGEQIPLAARIFAIVDVWDALRSDRPYRPGWPVEKIREYILEQSGKHFDPYVVNAFMELMSQNPDL